jgi:hypothetical protein
MRNSWKVINFARTIRENCSQRWKLSILYLTAKLFNKELQLLVKLRAKEEGLHIFHVFLTIKINS